MAPWILAALAALIFGLTEAVEWHFLSFFPPSGQQFTQLSGTMLVPHLPKAATYYLWPGLQPIDNSGVYQEVLDGRSGTWYWGAGWCCANPSLPWGNGFSASEGQSLTFQNVKGSSQWTSRLGVADGSHTATSSFPLNSKNFNQAVFAIELYDTTWDFGPLKFSNIVITSTGTDTSFCNSKPSNYNSATKFAISGVNAIVRNGAVDCHIDSLILQSPA